MSAEDDPWARSPEHQPSDDELIQRGIEHADAEGVDIPDSTARRIAMQWHSGQASAMYSFGSTGAIKRERLVTETLDIFREISAFADENDRDRQRYRVEYLGSYFAHKGDRPPVPGWHLLTADGQPAIVYMDEPTPLVSETTEDYIGRFPGVRAVAEHLLAQTGIWQAIESCIEQCGASLSPYINVDVDRYASDLASDVHMLPTENGEYEVYWRSDDD